MPHLVEVLVVDGDDKGQDAKPSESPRARVAGSFASKRVPHRTAKQQFLWRIATISKHPALWSKYASLEELRGKIGYVVKDAIPKSKSPGPTSLHSAVDSVPEGGVTPQGIAVRVGGTKRMFARLCAKAV